MGAEEEAVEDVQALLVGVAFGPGLGVAGAEEFGNGNAGDGAGPAPVVHEGLAEEVLAAALFDEGERFGGARRVGIELGDFSGVVFGGLIGKRHRQFSGAAQQAAQGGFVGGLEGVSASVLLRQTAGEFGRRRALGEGHLPDVGRGGRRDVCLGLVSGGKHHHSLRRALPNVLPAMGVAGFFDEGAFEGVHY